VRDGYHLTEAAQAERDDFVAAHGSEGNCSCFIFPPCGCCTHPGNPRNQAEDDGAWEKDDPLHHMLYVGDDKRHLSGLLQYTEEQKAMMVEEAHASIRENRPFDISWVRASLGIPVDPSEEWFQEPAVGRRFFVAPDPIQEEMCAPLRERPNPRRVAQQEIIRRRRARKASEASKRRNRR
jgi:hypothetical protein